MRKLGFCLILLIITLFFFCQTSDANNCTPHIIRQSSKIQAIQQIAQQVLIVGIPVESLGLPYYWSVGHEVNEERIIKGVYDKIKAEGKIPQSKIKSDNEITKDIFRLLPQKISLTNLDKEVQGIFKKYNCNTCHKAGQSVPGIRLYDGNGGFPVYSQEERERILKAVDSGYMPKNGDSLTDAEKDTIENWLNQ